MVELQMLVAHDRVEAVSDALIDEAGALSVSVEDADAGTAAERALFGEPGSAEAVGGWPRSTLKALFDDETAALDAATRLLAAEGEDERRGTHHRLVLQSIEPVPDQDWVRLTQAQFAPVAITPSFWIVPTWHVPPSQASRVIRLDPGQAFGTGTHPTTRMCLRWIARHADSNAGRWARALDYGCGSGILAIGAALHGARDVDAVDIDPAAVQATEANARDNGVSLRAGLPAVAHGTYDLVLANILAAPLKLLAPLLCAHVAVGGDLVLAGILERQADELEIAYAGWLALTVDDTEDGWILMTGRRVA